MSDAKLKPRLPSTLDFEEIKSIIPQRFPFLMLDRITELIPGERIVGLKNLTGNEWFYQGHFPTRAITPGAMILEAIAQTGIIFFHFSTDQDKRTVTHLLGKANIRFMKPVFPGSQLVIKIVPIKIVANAGILSAEVRVNEKIVARGEFSLGVKEGDKWQVDAE